MKRREFLNIISTTAAGLTLGCSTLASVVQKRQSRPNILFIMTDQQHAGMMSCTGNKWLDTPAMDGLAASGIRFERAYACNPVCAPNRFSLQTGLMPSAIGVGNNGEGKQGDYSEAMLQRSLGHVFKSAGYETVYGGKLHIPARINNVEQLGYRKLTGDARMGLADACAEYIKGEHTKPFFIFASFINPHDICYMALNDHARSLGKPTGKKIAPATCEAIVDKARKSGDVDAFVKKNCPPLPENYEVPDNEPTCITEKYLNARRFRAYARANYTDTDWRIHRWAYCRLTEMVDKEIGVVIDALKEARLEEDTLVVFTSDHGDMDSAHRLEHKSVLYEESARIPFIMTHKGAIPEGVVDDTHFVSNGMDLLPTLCDYAGVKKPEDLPGLALGPLARGERAANWRDYVVVESHHGRMVRTDHFKYCIYDSGEHREQLTDLKNDPGEMNNLAEDPRYKSELDKHRRLLKEWVESTGDKIAADYIVG
ncbi:sulfatase [Candidatus Hydrogenedentota bacterium]